MTSHVEPEVLSRLTYTNKAELTYQLRVVLYDDTGELRVERQVSGDRWETVEEPELQAPALSCAVRDFLSWRREQRFREDTAKRDAEALTQYAKDLAEARAQAEAAKPKLEHLAKLQANYDNLLQQALTWRDRYRNLVHTLAEARPAS